jgi:PPM family protein phosphatase
MNLTLRYAVRSDRGLVRTNNEDSVYAGPRLLAIADGMGGHAAGEVASKIVIGVLEPLDEDRPISDLISTLRATVADANSALAESVQADLELEGMGTTLTAIRFADSRIALVHVGDSRAYLVRDGQLSQITRDDTYVQSLVDAGQITAEEAASHPRKSVILRALTGAAVEPDVSIRETRIGDRYLLCTDGLSDVVSSATLLDTLAVGSPHECADRLIELALRGGGPDNVTCIVADVVEQSDGDDRPVIAGAVTDPSSAVESTEDSPAMRAARISRESLSVPVLVASRRRLRRSIFAGVAVAIVVVAALVGWSWTQQQYFVGRDGDQVAAFKGVNAHFGPITLYSVIQNSDLKISDLNSAARTQVESGIIANNRADAAAILKRLESELLPLCTALTPSPSPTPTPSSAPPAVSGSSTAGGPSCR